MFIAENEPCLIKYKILDILDEMECSTEYEIDTKQYKNKKVPYNPIVRVSCTVQSELGAVAEITTYWLKSDWEKQKEMGYFEATSDAIADMIDLEEDV